MSSEHLARLVLHTVAHHEHLDRDTVLVECAGEREREQPHVPKRRDEDARVDHGARRARVGGAHVEA